MSTWRLLSATSRNTRKHQAATVKIDRSILWCCKSELLRSRLALRSMMLSGSRGRARFMWLMPITSRPRAVTTYTNRLWVRIERWSPKWPTTLRLRSKERQLTRPRSKLLFSLQCKSTEWLARRAKESKRMHCCSNRNSPTSSWLLDRQWMKNSSRREMPTTMLSYWTTGSLNSSK